MAELGQTPPALDARPELPACFLSAWECFNELANDRPGGLGVSAIPWTSIAQWASFHHISDVAGHVAIVQAADRAYLDWQQEHADRGTRGNPKLRPRNTRNRR